jgi:hypothetical protein
MEQLPMTGQQRVLQSGAVPRMNSQLFGYPMQNQNQASAIGYGVGG